MATWGTGKRTPLEQAVAQKFYDLRTEVGLLQGEVAELVGSNRSRICNVENRRTAASLRLIEDTAAALYKSVRITLVPIDQEQE